MHINDLGESGIERHNHYFLQIRGLANLAVIVQRSTFNAESAAICGTSVFPTSVFAVVVWLDAAHTTCGNQAILFVVDITLREFVLQLQDP